jgi:hypothetical protein
MAHRHILFWTRVVCTYRHSATLHESLPDNAVELRRQRRKKIHGSSCGQWPLSGKESGPLNGGKWPIAAIAQVMPRGRMRHYDRAQGRGQASAAPLACGPCSAKLGALCWNRIPQLLGMEYLMSSGTLEKLGSEVLGLPEHERAELAHALVKSLVAPVDAEVADAWAREIL